MPTTHISYQDTGYFSKMICDYLSEKDSLFSFYQLFPTIENFEKQIALKNDFSLSIRNTLSERLLFQYRNINISKATQKNIQSLANEKTYTITTGHQLNLFTGPLYFLFKIFSVINLSEELNKKYKKNHFVPVYWMATEDHDFDEINYFNLFGKKVSWNRESGGAVGEISTEGLEEIVEVLKDEFGSTDHAKKLIDLFTESYVKHDNLADATRYLANDLFAQYGLVIVDGNDSELKKSFTPFVEKELSQSQSHNVIVKTSERIKSKGYKEQVHPREINLFYIHDGIRERIIKRDNTFHINGSGIEFSEEQILKELENYPERFSPNALLRPLYQEVILPNLCYVGGGGELAYWFQLKDYFESVSVPFPMLLLRNSVLIMPEKLDKKLQKLNENVSSLFLNQHDLEVKHTHHLTDVDIDFSEQRNHLKKQFEHLFELADLTDKSFLGAVGAQEKKQLNGLDRLEKRLLKAQKRKLKDELERLTSIQDQLFPKESLQERTVNFSELYLQYGDSLLDEIKKELDPLVGKFTILKLA